MGTSAEQNEAVVAFSNAAVAKWESKSTAQSNRQQARLDALGEAFIAGGTAGRHVLETLVGSSDARVRMHAAYYLLELAPMDAQRVLQEVAQSNDNLVGFHAGVLLDIWKERRSVASVRLTVPVEDNPSLASLSNEQLDEVLDLLTAYDGEVQNGGHFQFFENAADERVGATVAALAMIGAEEQLKILKEAVERWRGASRSRPKEAEQFLALRREVNLDDLDARYFACDPSLERVVLQQQQRGER